MIINIITILMLVGLFIYMLMLQMRVKKLFEALVAFAPIVEQFSSTVDRSVKSVADLAKHTENLSSADRPDQKAEAEGDPRKKFKSLLATLGVKQ